MTVAPGLLASYFTDVGHVDLLTAEEEVELAWLIRAGDQDARRTLIRANLPLVTWFARNYRGRGLPLDDLIQEGSIGLMRAVEMFDPEAGYRFSTYANRWIRQAFQRALMNTSRPIRVPVHVQHLAGKTDEQIVRRLPGTHAESRSGGSLAKSIGRIRDAERVVAMHQLSLGLHDPDWVIDPAERPDEQVANAEEWVRDVGRLGEAIEGLDPRERRVIRENYGLDGGPRRSLAALGRDLGVSRRRVEQLRKRAIQKIGADLRGRSARAMATRGDVALASDEEREGCRVASRELRRRKEETS